MPDEATDDDSGGEAEQENQTPLITLARSVWNLDLLVDARGNLEGVDWFSVSITTFYLGFIGMSVWSLLIILALLVDYLASAPSLLTGARRVVQIGPMVPVLFFVFGIAASRAVGRLQTARERDQQTGPGKLLSILLISSIALTAAGTFRWATYTVTSVAFGRSLAWQEVGALMIFDGAYISLVLVGVGGVGMLVFESEDES